MLSYQSLTASYPLLILLFSLPILPILLVNPVLLCTHSTQSLTLGPPLACARPCLPCFPFICRTLTSSHFTQTSHHHTTFSFHSAKYYPAPPHLCRSPFPALPNPTWPHPAPPPGATTPPEPIIRTVMNR